MKLILTEDWIREAKKVHGRKYDYSKSIYISAKSYITIICPHHGEFQQRPDVHLSGCGCPRCATSNQTMTLQAFIKRANKLHHNKYDYSKFIYVNSHIKGIIICPIHGEFLMTPNGHLSSRGTGHGCPRCKVVKLIKFLTKSKEDFIQEANIIHKNKGYIYFLDGLVNRRSKIKINCPKHGPFYQLAQSHLSGCGCPKCKSSYGETTIRNFLIDKNIEFIQEYKFLECKSIKPLPFDFFIPSYNLCIEFQGIQHYQPVPKFGGSESFDSLQRHDYIKSEYCSSNNIPLLVIKFDDNILEKLQNQLNAIQMQAEISGANRLTMMV